MKKTIPVNESFNNSENDCVETSPRKKLDSLQKGETDPLTGKKELNGPKGLEPTRYGDWESKGRCYDF